MGKDSSRIAHTLRDQIHRFTHRFSSRFSKPKIRFLEEMYNRINEDEATVTVSCPECGANLEVVAVSPVELELTSDEDDGLGLSEDEEDEKETDAEEDFE